MISSSDETPAGTKIDCYLDAVIFRDEVMIYIGYVMHGGADVMLSFRNRMNFRRINHHTGSKSRDSMQILSLGGLLPRNEYMDFTFYIQSSNSSCYMDEDGIVLLAYQARYSPRGCRVY